MKTSDIITFVCPDCGRRADVPRLEKDHPTAVVCKVQCERCDDGDFHEPSWFDASGKQLMG